MNDKKDDDKKQTENDPYDFSSFLQTMKRETISLLEMVRRKVRLFGQSFWFLPVFL